ncbi:putative E3 ubiquitin-protein ligase RING1a, partial [Mucuna pruriens]
AHLLHLVNTFKEVFKISQASLEIQASIAQTRQRQSEVLSRKQNAMARAVAFGRSQGNHRTSHLRRRRNAGELQVPIDNEDINDNDAGNDDLSSGDETKETMPEIGGVSDENEDTNDNNMEDFSSGDEKTKIGGERETQFPQESATMDEDGTGDENIPDENEYISSSGTLASSDINDECSNTQVNDNNARSSRISRLIEHLRNSDVKDEELEIHLMVVSSDEEKIPRLQEPYLCCRPCVSVKILCKYVALKSGLLAHQVELSLVQDPKINIISGEGTVDPEKDKLRVLGDEETLAELFTWNAKTCGHLVNSQRLLCRKLFRKYL